MSLPALVVRLSAARNDPALGERGARKLLATEVRRGSERETEEAEWRAAEPCPVAAAEGLEIATFNERAAQDRHYHRRGTEIYIVLDGTMTIEVEGREYVLTAGDMIVVAPGARHEVRRSGTPFLSRVIISGCGGEADKFTY